VSRERPIYLVNPDSRINVKGVTIDRDEFASKLSARLHMEESELIKDGVLATGVYLDSLRRLELSVLLEEAGVQLEDQEIIGLTSLEQLYKIFSSCGPESIKRLSRDQGNSVGRPSSVEVRAPSLQGRRTALVPVTRDLVPFLYQLSTSTETGFRWRYRGTIPSSDSFEAGLTHGVLCHFVVASLETQNPIGYVVCYNREPSQGFAYIGMVFRENYIQSGIPMEAAGVFVSYVFWTYSLRKLYLEVPEFNFHQISSGAGRFFDVEGRLVGHDYYARRYWDQYILAIYPDHLPTMPSDDPYHVGLRDESTPEAPRPQRIFN
jgi:hypothetical protein